MRQRGLDALAPQVKITADEKGANNRKYCSELVRSKKVAWRGARPLRQIAINTSCLFCACPFGLDSTLSKTLSAQRSVTTVITPE
jgi:hypothetical protein